MRDGEPFLHPGQVKNLWTVLRRSIPKFRARRIGIAPHKLVALESQWIPYLSDLEVGSVVSAEDLLRHCVIGQQARTPSLPEAVPLSDLPSLQTVETALRKTQGGRSTGLDGIPSETFHNFPVQMAAIYYHLVLKIFMWGQEPLQFKGGQMAMIPKKADLSQVANFRGILLLPSMAKRIHALAREQLIQKFLPFRDEGQLGGLPGQQVQYGSHAVRAAAQILASHHFSVGVLFIDLTNAFHRLVREWVTGVQDLPDFQTVLTALQQAGNQADFRARADELQGLLASFDCSPTLRRLLEDIHSDAWFQMRLGPAVRTRRGTRPGSPLADAVFHLLMGTITSKLRDWVKAHPTFNLLLQEAGIDAPIVVWSDDLALVWATRTATALPSELKLVMETIDGLFQDYGFSINYNKNKTEAVVTFRGAGAVAMRKEFAHCGNPGILISPGADRNEWLHFSSSYKHLGTMYSASHTLEQELRHRLGAAKGAFRQLAKPILCNLSYPRNLRVRLFDSLVASKLFFGLGAWATPTVRLLQKLRVAYIEMLKKVLKINRYPSEHCSHKRVLAAARAGDVRARLAIDRLAYARRAFQTGPPFLQHLLATEFDVNEDSWLHGLFADLKWLNALLPGELPENSEKDLTALVGLWQQPNFPWQRMLKRAWRRYLQQEQIMMEIEDMHKGVYRTLKAGGAQFTPDPEWPGYKTLRRQHMDVIADAGSRHLKDWRCTNGRCTRSMPRNTNLLMALFALRA